MVKSHGELSYLTGKIHRLQQRARAKEQAVFLLFDCERMFVYRPFNISLCKKKKYTTTIKWRAGDNMR